MSTVLIIDDNPDILDALELLLTLHQHRVIMASSAKQALLSVDRQNIDLVIQDMNFSFGATDGVEGEALFHEIKKRQPTLPIVLLTAWTSIDNAVKMVKAGATDYLPKPWDDNKLLELVTQYTAGKTSETIVKTSQLIYQSDIMSTLVSQCHKVARSDVNVLITGPNGAGKEKIAEEIHQHSERADAPLIKVNMGALPHDLIEAELFGAEKGAFTGANEKRLGRFEAADGGTLFLDEIGNLSLSGQMKLLRVLQTGEFERVGSSETVCVDVRILSATNTDLIHAVKEGTFREDLFYRLNTVELKLPALRERKQDILMLAQHFLGLQYTLSENAKQYLLQHSWPGNVRELENACHRAKIFCESNFIDASDFDSTLENTYSTTELEAQQIQTMLEKHNWVILHAAKALGLSRQALYRRMEKYQIEKPE